jgi:hypothetical protein
MSYVLGLQGDGVDERADVGTAAVTAWFLCA